MGTYRDGVKRKGDKIEMGYNCRIVCMCIIMRRSDFLALFGMVYEHVVLS